MFARIRQLLAPFTQLEAAGGRRYEGRRQGFGSVNPEVLAAAAPVRSRARYAFANNPWIERRRRMGHGSCRRGITPSPQHPTAATRKL